MQRDEALEESSRERILSALALAKEREAASKHPVAASGGSSGGSQIHRVRKERGSTKARRDDSLQSGEKLIEATRASDLVPGAAIRIWHPHLQDWIPGWWLEVLRVDGDQVHLQDLQSGEEWDRTIDVQRGGWYLHPAPDRLRSLGEARERRRRKALDALRAQYEAMDFSTSSVEDIVEALRSELRWRDEHDFSYLKDEFGIREIAIRRVGSELDKRGGEKLMLEVFKKVPGTRDLEGLWDQIGGWWG